MRPRPFAFLLIAVSLAIVTVGANRARADVPPPDLCTSPGQPCQNAGANANQAGTCMATTCTKTIPDGDGGTTGGGKSSGCSIAAGGPADAAGGSMMALALLGIALGRRRPPR
jgi:MYXO-CTERM domain-containing protein